MGREWKGTSSYTLTSKEVEKLLLNDFGDKIHPVNEVKMAKQRRNQANRHAKKEEAESNAKDQNPENMHDPGV